MVATSKSRVLTDPYILKEVVVTPIYFGRANLGAAESFRDARVAAHSDVVKLFGEALLGFNLVYLGTFWTLALVTLNSVDLINDVRSHFGHRFAAFAHRSVRIIEILGPKRSVYCEQADLRDASSVTFRPPRYFECDATPSS